MGNGIKPLTVVHSHPVWLPQTQTWMHAMLSAPSNRVRHHVVCEQTENLDQFPISRITCLSTAYTARYAVERLARKARICRQVPCFSRAVKNAGGRVIHSHFGNFGWRDSRAARRLGLPHVVTFYGADASRLPAQSAAWRRRYADLFASCDRVVCEGEHMGQRIRDLGCPGPKVAVQPIGVDVEKIAFAPRAWDGKETLRVLIAASFRPKKGIVNALEALARLSRTVDLTVTVIGDASAEPQSRAEKKRIRQAVEDFGIANRVTFAGFQPYSAFLKAAYAHHIFVQASLRAADGDDEGGAPVSLIEMAASGMPIVSTRHCDIPSVVIDGATGYLAAERDIDDLANCMRRWADAPGQWERMLRAGRTHVEEKFNLKKQALTMEYLYLSLAGR